jgi:hypothetical protein
LEDIHATGFKGLIDFLQETTPPPCNSTVIVSYNVVYGWGNLRPLFEDPKPNLRTGLSLDMTLNTVISCVPFFANWIFSVIFRHRTPLPRRSYYLQLFELLQSKLA